MMNKNIIYYSLFTMILFFTVTESLFGQRWKLRRYEVGGGAGITQVFGDIGGTAEQKNWYGLKDIKFDETRMAFGLLARYKLDPVYTIKANAILGFGNGTDAESRNNRGREYKTTLFEFSFQGEYYFLAEEKRFRSAAMFDRRGMLNNYSTFSAYGFLGLGMVYSKAKVTYTGFDPAPTDKVKNSNIGAAVPFGIGLKYIIDDRWLINTELGYRYTFTDFIDGFTQTVYSKHKDVYYFLTLSVCYRLDTSRRGLPAIFDRKYKRVR